MKPSTTDVISTIGHPRITPYRTFFQCQNDDETLGAYFWGQAVATAFQPCLGMYEVVLRNAVHRAASMFASKQTSDSYPWYDYTESWALPTRGKTRDKVTEILYSASQPPLRLSPQPPPDAVIASLSFGFWPSFLEGLTMREQPRILTDTFPGHPHSKPKHWSNSQNVAELIAVLKEIQALRNAVAHLEPIWKPHRLTGKEKNWSHSVQSLRGRHDQMLRVMSWCCPNSAAALEQSYGRRIFKSVCSTDAVKAFKSDPFASGVMERFVSQNTTTVPVNEVPPTTT